MLQATGITALARKAKDEKARKKEARQGVLSVGPSDVARRAFEGQTKQMMEAGPAGAMGRAGTNIKYEDPNDIGAESSDDMRPIGDIEKPAVEETKRASQIDASTPVLPDTASLMDQTVMTLSSRDTHGDEKSRPPTYVSRVAPTATSANSLSRYSQADTLTSQSTRSTNSIGTHAVRVKTRGPQLSSGFEYHPSLFELKVHPEKWVAFTEQVVHTTKLDPSDSRKAWAAATGVALSGAIVTSIFLKKSMDRSFQEKKVKAAISDMSDGSLGSMLQRWNDEYFTKQGVFVHLELSESAMKNDEQKSKTFRKPSLLYSKREERERKEEERKYVIVVTKLDADCAPTEAIREMEFNEERTGQVGVRKESETIAEMPGDTYQGFLIPELPGDDGLGMAELPGGVSLGYSSEKAMAPPPGLAELEPGDVTALTIEQAIPREMDDTSWVVEEKAVEKEKPLAESVRERTAFDKEAT